MEKIEFFLRNYLGITDDDIIRLGASVAHIQNVPKREFLYKRGDRLSGVPFLMSGLFRFFFTDINGIEHTDCFCGDPGFPIMPSMGFDCVLPIDIQALEDSELLVIPVELIQYLVENNMEIMRMYNKMLMESVRRHWETKMALYQYGAEDRYAWFLEQYSGLIDRIPHVYIASFLNMNPVTLIRIRSKKKTE